MRMRQPIIQTEIGIIGVEKRGSVTTFAVEPPFPLPDGNRFGIDPGTVNMGIATIHVGRIMCHQIKMKREKEALYRILTVQKMLSQYTGYLSIGSTAIIEGAAFGSYYRQVELAEVRSACILWFYKHLVEVKVIPPNTIRKAVFGKATISNPWSNLPNDCAAALACAYYPFNFVISSSIEQDSTQK